MAASRVNHLFVPDPLDVLNDLKISISSGALQTATLYTLRRILVATLLSIGISLPVGLAIYNIPIIKDIIYPVIMCLRYIPVTAFYPLLIMWFGINETMKIIFLFVAMFVSMMPSVILCLEEINEDLINTGMTMGMDKTQLVLLVQLPATLPSIMKSFVVSIGIGFSYIAVCETINAIYGLGWIIQQNSSRGRTDMVFMAIIVLVILSVIFDMVGNMLIRKIFKWRFLKEDD
jgi:NitT/TauT family transport system permease protein